MAIHMSQGDGEDSYSKNSEVQKMIQDQIVVPFLREALTKLRLPAEIGTPVVIADLGCSSGPNAIALVSAVVRKIKELRLHSETESRNSFDIQAFFNDLPTSDFNTMFQLLSSPDVKRSDFFVAGVPGSFYGPLFPPSTVHVFVSSLALHYLSQIPASVTDENSPAFNKGHWWVTGSVAGEKTAKACGEQSVKDLDAFLRFRTKELVPGGVMVLAFTCSWDPESNGTGRVEAFQAASRQIDGALVDLVQEGVLTEDHVDSHNLHLFFPTFGDVKEAVRKHDSGLEVVALSEVDVKPFVDVTTDGSPREVVKAVMTMYRGAFSELTRSKFGKQAADLFWESFERRVAANIETVSGESPTALVALRKKDR